MKEEYKVNIAGLSSFSFSEKDIANLNVAHDGKGEYHLIYQGKTYKIKLLNREVNKKEYVLELGNREYPLKILNPLDLRIEAMGFESSKADKIHQITAPMPGLILDISIKNGEEVKENQPLLILEAMKMENVLTSPRDGIIKNICCARGDAVEKTQLLVEFEN